MDIAIQKFKELLQNPQKSILTLHRRPDGDSIGSNLALYQVLKNYGHTVEVYSKDPIPDTCAFLPFTKEIKYFSPKEVPWSDFNLYWALDMSNPLMLGEEVSFPSNLSIFTIDHHASNIPWGQNNIFDVNHISTASLLYELFKESNISINKDIATCLMTGLATDSGFFVHNKDSKAFKVAAELLELGVDYQKIVFEIERQINLEDIQFIGKALEQIHVYKEKKAVILPVPYEVWKNYGVSKDKNYLLTTYVRSIKDTNFGVVVIEEQPNSFRLDFRARVVGFDVARIAKELGGGGHIAAAGARIEGVEISIAVNKILSLI